MGRHAREATPRGNRWERMPRISRVASAATALGITAVALFGYQNNGDTTSPPPAPQTISAPIEATGVDLPNDVMLDAEGPYIGPDLAHRQMNFMDPELTEVENMEAGIPDMEQMKEDGIDFVFAKATEDDNFVDPYFSEVRERADDAHMLFGAYHFLNAGDGAKQADFFYQQLEKTGGAEGAMMMVDVEFEGGGDETGPSYQDLLDYTDRLQELVPDREIIVYTTPQYWGNETREGHLDNPPAPNGTVLNWANYVDGTAPLDELVDKVGEQGTPEDPYPRYQIGTYDKYAFRQFTSEALYGPFQGQSLPNEEKAGQSTMDVNITYESREELLELAGLSAEDNNNTTEVMGDSKPDADQLWQEYMAKDPAQAELEISPECISEEVATMDGQERYRDVIENIYGFEPSKEKYEDAIAKVIDIRAQARDSYPRNFAYDAQDPAFDNVTDIKSQVKHWILHFTAEGEPERDGMQMASFMDQLDRGTGYNYYINDTGEQANTYYTSDQFVYQIKDKSNGVFGVEVAGCTQNDISAQQYEQLLYLSAHFMEEHGFINKDEPVAAFVEEFVQGHREYAGAEGHTDWPAVVADPFKQRLVNFLVDDLGYKR